MLKRDLVINASIQKESKTALQKNEQSVQEQSDFVETCNEHSVAARERYRGAVKKVEKTNIFLKQLGKLAIKTKMKQEEG